MILDYLLKRNKIIGAKGIGAFPFYRSEGYWSIPIRRESNKFFLRTDTKKPPSKGRFLSRKSGRFVEDNS